MRHPTAPQPYSCEGDTRQHKRGTCTAGRVAAGTDLVKEGQGGKRQAEKSSRHAQKRGVEEEISQCLQRGGVFGLGLGLRLGLGLGLGLEGRFPSEPCRSTLCCDSVKCRHMTPSLQTCKAKHRPVRVGARSESQVDVTGVGGHMLEQSPPQRQVRLEFSPQWLPRPVEQVAHLPSEHAVPAFVERTGLATTD